MKKAINNNSAKEQNNHIGNTLIMSNDGPIILNGKEICCVLRISAYVGVDGNITAELTVDPIDGIYIKPSKDGNCVYLQGTVIHDYKEIDIIPGDTPSVKLVKIVFQVNKVSLCETGYFASDDLQS